MPLGVMTDKVPPPAIASVPLLEFAIVGDLAMASRSLLFVDGVEVAAVPFVAICGLEPTGEVQLVYCDAAWNQLGAAGYADIATAKAKAQRMYPSLEWLPSPHSQPAVEQYLQRQWEGLECSFCGRAPMHFEKLIKGLSGVAICSDCISRFHREMGD
jgi:hypothetical protein